MKGKRLLVAGGLAGVLLGSPLVLVLAAGVAAELTASSCGAPAVPAVEATPGRAGGYGGVALSADQVGNAAAIYTVGRAMGVPDYGISSR